MKVYTYTEARQKLASLLDNVVREGSAMIKRRDGQTFVVKLQNQDSSPLDVEGIDLDMTTAEITGFIRESRRK